MFCNKCGTENEDESKFCSSCGNNLEEIQTKGDGEESVQEEGVENKTSLGRKIYLGVLYTFGFIILFGYLVSPSEDVASSSTSNKATQTIASTSQTNPTKSLEEKCIDIIDGAFFLACAIREFGMSTTEFTDIGRLVKNGNYSLGQRLDGGTCFIDVNVNGIANGNSYNTNYSCEVHQDLYPEVYQ